MMIEGYLERAFETAVVGKVSLRAKVWVSARLEVEVVHRRVAIVASDGGFYDKRRVRVNR